MTARLLLFGRADFPLFFELAARLAGTGRRVEVLALDPVRRRRDFEAVGVPVHAPLRSIGPRGVRGLVKVAGARRRLAALGRFDAVGVHFMDPRCALLAGPLRAATPRLVCTYWGSDLYRRGRAAHAAHRVLLRRSDAVTVLHDQMREAVGVAHGEAIAARTALVRFGLTPLDAMRARRGDDRTAMRHALGLPPAGPVVCVGYNAAPGQRHLQVLDALEAAGLPDDVVVVLPLQYGGTAAYRAEVIARARERAGPTVAWTEDWGPDRVALLRLVTDVLVQVQPTDALSGSMQEHLYGGAVVVTGAWLRYRILDELGVSLVRVPTVAEAGARVCEVLGDLPSWQSRCAGNPERIWALSSWAHTLPDWLEVLEV